MRQLPEQDAAFLYLETEHSPMQNGGLYLFDSSTRTFDFDFQELKEYVASRLHLAPFFRQRLVEVPLKLDHPYWVDDPEFDLDKHLFRITLRQKGDINSLYRLASQNFSVPLRRDRPLWEIVFVNGLENIEGLSDRHFALIVKMHQSAIDPLRGQDAISLLLDFDEHESAIPPPQPWTPEVLPSSLKLLGSAYNHAITSPLRLASMARDSLASSFYALLLQRLSKQNLPPTLFSAPKTLLNQNIDETRSFTSIDISLEKLKAIKTSIGHGITLNDVILGICAEALNSYLASENNLPPCSLIAMSPISVRSKHIHKATGYEMAVMLLSLSTDESDPAWRILRIHENAIVSKHYGQAVSAPFLTKSMPSSMMGLAARIYTEFQLAQRHKPLFNIPVINVPGPQKPLYLNGCQLIRQAGSSPIFDGVGVSMTIISYQSTISFCVTTCPGKICDASVIRTHVERALATIEACAQGKSSEEPPPYTPVKVQSPSLMEIGSMVIEDVVALFQNLFAFRKPKNDPGQNNPEDT